MTGQRIETLNVVDMLEALRTTLAKPTRHLHIVPTLDDEQVANEMRLEQAAEARRDERIWGRDERADWAGETR